MDTEKSSHYNHGTRIGKKKKNRRQTNAFKTIHLPQNS